MNATFDSVIKSKTLDIDLRSAGPASESLNTLCTDLFLIIMNITPKVDMGTEDELRRILRYYVDQFDQNCAAVKIDTTKQNYVKYALVALIDEKVLKLPAKWSDPWRSHMLQLDCFGDMVAGERFFEYLDLLQKNPSNYYDVLEIYYLCLNLGFKGKHQFTPKELQALIASLPKAILSSRPKTINPDATSNRQETKPRGHIPMVPTWAIAIITLSIITLSWFGVKLTINSISRKLLPIPEETVSPDEHSLIDYYLQLPANGCKDIAI